MHLVILVEKLYEDLEVWYPKIFFEARGVKVTVAGPDKTTYHGKNGIPVSAHARIADLDPKKIDAVIIPGGFAPDYLRRSSDVLTFVRTLERQGKPVGAICHAGWVLISAGLAKGRKLTGYFAIKDDLMNAGAKFMDAPVVVDKNLITSRFPADLPFFCEAIANQLG
jgi:protease I